jgi:xanthine phosphoribosyltransferase
MHELDQRIRAEAVYLGDGIVKLDSFLNHRIDTLLMTQIGVELARLLIAAGASSVSSARSHTKGEIATLYVSTEFLSRDDRVVIVDDFLGTGETAEALLDLVEQSSATLCGIGYVIEKVYEHGRDHMRKIDAPIVSLARIDIDNEQVVLR